MMRKKLISVAGGFLVTAFLFGVGSIAYQAEATTATYDFGDAPDNGYFTHYGNSGASIGSFPSLLSANGAHVSETGVVWLGGSVNTETDAKLVNADQDDDGVALDLTSCATSTAKVVVHLANPGEITGTAYVNMFFDWNKDGAWSGADDCADEWAVRNFPVDIGAQDQTLQVVVPEFMAGKIIKKIWYRAIITQDQRLTYQNQNGQGEFLSGEVEDYGPKIPAASKKFGAVCKPDLLVIRHGKAGNFIIKKKPGSVPIADALLANSVTPKTKGRRIDDTGLGFTYQSLRVDGPQRVVWETIPVKVRFVAKIATKIVNCNVAVVHGKFEPTEQNLGDYTTTELTGNITGTSNGTATTLSGSLTLTGDTLVSRGVHGIEIPLEGQNPSLGTVPIELVSLSLAGGSCPPCTVDNDTHTIRCLGTEPFALDSENFFDIFFGEVAPDLNSLHLYLLDSAGEVITGADLPVQNEVVTVL